MNYKKTNSRARTFAKRIFERLLGAQTALFFGLFATALTAVHSADWAKLGVRVVRSAEEQSRTRLDLEDGQGRTFSVAFVGKVSDTEAARVLKLRETFLGWSLGKPKSIEFLISGTALEAHVLLEKVTCAEKDLTELLPAGLLFRQTDAVDYNFRLATQNLFVRIKGVYTSDQELCGKLLAAADNPRDYIRKRDPEYILRTLDRLRSDLNELRLKQERVRLAMVALHNRGFFSGPKPPQQKTVDLIIEYKSKERSLTAAQLTEKLKAAGVQVSADEVELILAVYYNEYAK